jgi:hypothetical protein
MAIYPPSVGLDAPPRPAHGPRMTFNRLRIACSGAIIS